MMPILYEATETAFTSEGLGRLSDALSCKVIHNLKNLYELEMEYPVNGIHYDDLTVDRIILALPESDKQAQPFRIYNVITRDITTIAVYARHISYQLNYIPTSCFNYLESGVSCTFASALYFGASGSACAFVDMPGTLDGGEHALFHLYDSTSFGSTKKTFAKSPHYRSVRDWLCGDENSATTVFGGEIDWDRWNVTFYDRLGADNHVFIRYGKNLLNLDYDTSTDSTYTGLVGEYFKEEKNTTAAASTTSETTYYHTITSVYSLETNAFLSPYAYLNGTSRIAIIDLTSLWDDAHSGDTDASGASTETPKPTTAELNAFLSDYAAKHRDELTTIPLSITVDFLDLTKTTDYEGRENLEKVSLGDTVYVQYPGMGIDIEARVAETDFDTIQEMYNTVTIGTVSTTIADAILGLTKPSTDSTGITSSSTFRANKLYGYGYYLPGVEYDGVIQNDTVPTEGYVYFLLDS